MAIGAPATIAAPSFLLYAEQIRSIAATLADGPGVAAQERALAILALLSGGMTMAHAVDDPKLGARIARAIVNAVEKIGTNESH